jgi:hypothetical protein
MLCRLDIVAELETMGIGETRIVNRKMVTRHSVGEWEIGLPSDRKDRWKLIGHAVDILMERERVSKRRAC